MNPPSYPLRPVNGGPLHLARPKRGHWTWEPKVNGWRAWVNTQTGQMFNRKNEPLSIAAEFAPVLAKIKAARLPILWLDCEAFERRHPLGRGSLVLLDFAPGQPPVPRTMMRMHREIFLYQTLQGIAVPWRFLHEPPPADSLLSFAYTFADYGIPIPIHGDWDAEAGVYAGEDLDGIHTGWRKLQEVNQALGPDIDLFEGLVAKRLDSLYPLQLRSPDQEFPGWMKHRWRF